MRRAAARALWRLAAVAAAGILAASGRAQTNAPAGISHFEQIRNRVLEGRRHICGRVMQIAPNGLVVDSGYASLLLPPYNQSWVVQASVAPTRPASLIEEKEPDAVAVGLVYLVNIPRRPAVRLYDYVVIRGYPAGLHPYTPAPGVEKTLRCFSASLERAVQTNLAAAAKTGP